MSIHLFVVYDGEPPGETGSLKILQLANVDDSRDRVHHIMAKSHGFKRGVSSPLLNLSRVRRLLMCTFDPFEHRLLQCLENGTYIVIFGLTTGTRV